jgi:hypothetical protein
MGLSREIDVVFARGCREGPLGDRVTRIGLKKQLGAEIPTLEKGSLTVGGVRCRSCRASHRHVTGRYGAAMCRIGNSREIAGILVE